VWVDAVKLPEIDLVDAEPLETALGLRNQIWWRSVVPAPSELITVSL